MPYPITGNYDYTPLETPKIRDYASVYAAVGNALNQKYYQNRQAYIAGIVNPLSQVKASKRGQKVLNDVKSTISNEADKFRQRDNWFDADNFILNGTEYIANHEGLKAVQSDYALEQQTNEEIKNSGWDQQMQTAFKLRNNLNSTEIEYDPTTNTTSGGFNPVSIGKPFDTQKFYNSISDILSKAKEDSISTETLLTDPNAIRQYGLDVAMGADGEAIASHFIKTGYSKEGIDENTIFNYATQLLKNNPEYRQHLMTVWQNNDVLNRFVQDDSLQGGHLRDYTIDDYIPIFGNELPMYILNGLGITSEELSLIGSTNDKGQFVINTNLPANKQAEANNVINNINNKYGIDILSVLKGESQLPESVQQIALQNAVNKLYSTYGNDLDKNTWTQNILANNYINTTIDDIAKSYAGIFSNTKISSTIDWEANPAYVALVEARANGDPNLIDQAYSNIPTLETINGELLNDGGFNYDSYAKLNDTLNQLDAKRDKMFNASELKVLGLTPDNYEKLYDINYNDLSNIIDNNPNISDEDKGLLKAKVLEMQQANIQYNDTIALLEEYNLNVHKVFDVYQEYKDQIADGLGWFRVNDPAAKFILEHRIKNYDDFLNTLNELGYKLESNENGYYFRHGNDYVDALSEPKFNRIFKNAIENVSERYRKITNTPLEWVYTRQLINNPTPVLKDHIYRMMPMWESGAGSLTGVTNKGKTLDPTAISRLINLNVFPTTVTDSSKGRSISRQNTINQNTKPLDGKDYGVDFKIYKTEIVPVNNGHANRNGKQEYMIKLYDATGTMRDRIFVSENDDKIVLSNRLVEQYNYLHNSPNPNDPLIKRSLGSTVAAFTNGYVNFKKSPESNIGLTVDQIQTKVDQNGPQDVFIEFIDPVGGNINGNSRKVRVGKSSLGYYITDMEGLTIDGEIKLGYFNYNGLPNSLICIESWRPNPQGNIQKYYNSVADAVASASQYVLDRSAYTINFINNYNNAQIQQLNNSFIAQ